MKTLGLLLKYKMSLLGISSIPNMPYDILDKLLSDKYWVNSIPVRLFKNMLSVLEIDFHEAKEAIYISLPRWPKSSNRYYPIPELWECKEAVDKYVNRLEELMNKD